MSDINNCEVSNMEADVNRSDDSKDNSLTKEDENELELIKSYASELQSRFEQKFQERQAHDIKLIKYPDNSFFVKLDSSIKKNTAFVKKIRNMTEAQKDNIMKDLENLNLSRYISELASALVETKIKLNEIPMCVKICSVLHLRYQEFSSQLFDAWIKNLPRKSTDTFNSAKLRIDIRLFAELILTGIFSTKDALPILGNLLTILTTNDKENHYNLNIIISFCKQYGNEYAGLVPHKMRLLAEKHSIDLPKCDFLSIDRQKGVQNLLKDYYHSLVSHVLKDHKRIQNMESEMSRVLETKGEISKHHKEIFDSNQLDFQKLWASTQQFADLIDEELPQLSSTSARGYENDKNESTVVFDFTNRFRENVNLGMIWEDEETRTFYENLPDLKSLIPAILYKDSLKEAPATSPKENGEVTTSGNDAIVENGEASPKSASSESIEKRLQEMTDEEFGISDKDLPLLNENDEFVKVEESKSEKAESGAKSSSANKSTYSATKDQLDLFFSSLLNCVNRDFIDKAALTFATTFNTKNNRKSLVKALMAVPRTRLDLLPFYARFVAQLAPIMPTVASELVSALKGQFRYNFFKKDQVYIESKVKIIRFIGELVKFSIFPKPDVHYIFKKLLSDFHHHHIEMTCNLFETCGQYLYRCPDSYHMTKHLLEQMMRLKQRMVLDSRYEIMIENAFYIVNPPEDKLLLRSAPSKPIIYLFIEHIIYKELTKKTLSKVLTKLRKIDWKSEETSAFAIKCLSSACNLKFYNISALAHLLVGLSQHQSWAVQRVLDTLLEDIRLGMEINSFEFNQRRMASAKYLAECFNYNLIDSTLLFNVLYSLILYKINYQDASKAPLDPPNNLMRLRLVAQILNTCGMFLTSSPSKKKLEYFLLFFQRYYWLKKSCLSSNSLDPTDSNAQFYIENIFKDVIQFVRPRFRIADSYESSCKQLETRLKELADSAKELMPNAKISVKKVLYPKPEYDGVGMNANGLEPIEEEEDSLEEDLSNSQSMNPLFEEDEEGEDSHEEHEFCDEETDENMDYEEMPADHKETSDTDSEEVTQVSKPNVIQCEEDDLFQREFDALLTESMISRSHEVARPGRELSIPIERDTDKKKIEFNSQNKSHGSFSMSLDSQPVKKAFNFKIMTRAGKSNKPTLKPIEVAPDSDLVQNFLAREEELRAEKEAVKKLTLDINQRRELEDCGISNPRPCEVTNLSTARSNYSSGYYPQISLNQCKTGPYYYRKRTN